MSVTRIPDSLRRRVVQRAHSRCEYCRIPEAITLLGCEVDHIVSEKHGGATVENNLALACFACNRNKGSDLGSYLTPDSEVLTRFFHPRRDRWEDHFQVYPDGRIDGRTPEGMVTMRLFDFNAAWRIQERYALLTRGLFP